MNGQCLGYLILARCGIDDVPMGLYPDEKTAFAEMEKITEKDILQVARQAFQFDTSIVYSLTIIRLDGGSLPQIICHHELGEA